MAEILGAVANGITLAALLNACLEAFDLIRTGRKQELDFKKLRLRLNIERCRLYVWGESMGSTETSQAGEDRPIDKLRFPQLVREILETISELFNDTQKIRDRYGCRQVTPEELLLEDSDSSTIKNLAASFSNFATRSSARIKSSKPMCKIVWVIHDRERFGLLISEIKDLVDNLPAVSVARQTQTMRKNIAKIQDAETLSDIAEVCSDDHPDIADAASTRADTISLASTDIRYLSSWSQGVEVLPYGSVENAIQDLESLTVTELKHMVLEMWQAPDRDKGQTINSEQKARSYYHLDTPKSTGMSTTVVPYQERASAKRELRGFSSHRMASLDELVAMRAFATHARDCHICNDPLGRVRALEPLCRKGTEYVKDIGKLFYCYRGKPFSALSRKFALFEALSLGLTFTALRKKAVRRDSSTQLTLRGNAFTGEFSGALTDTKAPRVSSSLALPATAKFQEEDIGVEGPILTSQMHSTMHDTHHVNTSSYASENPQGSSEQTPKSYTLQNESILFLLPESVRKSFSFRVAALAQPVHARLVQLGWAQENDISLAMYILMSLIDGKTPVQIMSELTGGSECDPSSVRDCFVWVFGEVMLLIADQRDEPSEVQKTGGTGVARTIQSPDLKSRLDAFARRQRATSKLSEAHHIHNGATLLAMHRSTPYKPLKERLTKQTSMRDVGSRPVQDHVRFLDSRTPGTWTIHHNRSPTTTAVA